MKQWLVVIFLVTGLAACRKDRTEEVHPPQPVMQYQDLYNKEVKFNEPAGVDLDADGSLDFWFTTWHIGDPLLKCDIKQFHVVSGTHSRLLVGDNNNSPIYLKSSTIQHQGYGEYGWYVVSLVEFAQKVTPETGAAFWQGLWRNVQHKYLGVQLERAGSIYTGWIEVSFDSQGEKLLLHKAAISTEAFRSVRAGE